MDNLFHEIFCNIMPLLVVAVFSIFAFLNSTIMKRFFISVFPLLILFLIPAMTFSQTPEKRLAVNPVISSGSISKKIAAFHVPNSEPITFQVDMSQWAAKGKFNPATDSLDLPGTFNHWAGSTTLQKVDTTLVYQIMLPLDSLTVQQFRFRINHDSSRMEFSNGVNRMFRVPGKPMTVKYMYNDFDTTTVPMTFLCDMYYQIKAGHFNPYPYMDYLDVAGSMNNLGAYDVLFDVDHDSIYQVTLNLPRSLISLYIPIEFKFRINGNWNTSEFPDGGSFRTYFLKDTLGGIQNNVNVWYDDQDPGIPTPPWAYNLYIQGEHYVGSTLTGAYYYEDINLHPEGASIYKWYREDSINQVNPELRTGDTTINYVLDTTDYGKYIVFEVTPVAAGTGDSLVGKPVRTWTGPIVSVGIGELIRIKPVIYPNPVTSIITFTNMNNIQKIEIFSILGQRVGILEENIPFRMTYDASYLNNGIYFVKFSKQDHSFSTVKFIKN
jgi:energy-coupling factor transporter transmembrane protein EcfT